MLRLKFWVWNICFCVWFQPFWSLKLSTLLKFEISSFRRVEISRFRRVEISEQTNAKADDSNFRPLNLFICFLCNYLSEFLKLNNTISTFLDNIIIFKKFLHSAYHYFFRHEIRQRVLNRWSKCNKVTLKKAS